MCMGYPDQEIFKTEVLRYGISGILWPSQCVIMFFFNVGGRPNPRKPLDLPGSEKVGALTPPLDSTRPRLSMLLSNCPH